MSNSKTPNQPKSRIPSRRDQDIFRRVVVHCELQCKVAQDLGLSPGRVSQILTRVRRWLAGAASSGVAVFSEGKHGGCTATDLDATFSALERQRLERQLAKSRHEYFVEICTREINRLAEHPKHTTIRTEIKLTTDDSTIKNRDEGGECGPVRRIVTVRDQPLNVQLVKAAQRSTIELQKLAELQPLPPPEIAHSEDRRAQCLDLITELLDDAVANHKVRSVWDERIFAEDLLKFLLGEPHRGTATNIIAADAEHGRFRPNHCVYPGRDPMRIGAAPGPRGSSSNSGPGSTPGPHDPGHPQSGSSPASAGEPDQRPLEATLNNTKPHTTTANEHNASQPLSTAVSNPGSVTTSAHSSAPPPAIAPSELPLKKSQNFRPHPPVLETIRLDGPIVVTFP